jgi:arylsulfatase A-like enzyme
MTVVSRVMDFRSAILRLCLRLITLGIVALVFSEALVLAEGKAQGWTFYLTGREVVFEVAVRLVAAALAGMLAGTILSILVASVLWYCKSSRAQVVDWATKIAVVIVVFFVCRLALTVLIKWSYSVWTHSAVYDKGLLAGFYFAFLLVLCIPRTRTEVVTSLDGFLSEKMTRRTAIATIAGTAGLVATEYVLSKSVPSVKAALATRRPKSNFVLVTFDALDAEDMSLYGRGLPTTPNIDAFAGKGTLFSHFYSASTFTTPCVAAILTGLYPSETLVYHHEGRLHADKARHSLPHLLRASGYTTGAFVSNPLAYYLVGSFRNEFDVLPEPSFLQGNLQVLWDVSSPLHQHSGIGSRLDEASDLESACNFADLPNDRALRFRPAATFENARQVLGKLPEGFFLWVHAMAPHKPYIPDVEDRGRFISEAERRVFEMDPATRWHPHYEPDQQSQIERRRLAYDEYISSADRAFGGFLSELELHGKLENTTVIVSADHGESFEGGVYEHGGPYLTRPVIHVPLIIRTPGQQESRTIAFTADQTALAPTILELAGVPKPDSVRGQSLVPWLNGNGQANGKGLAFTQYLERNSVFKPLHHGSVGVIDGEYQYVVYLETQKGDLRPLTEAQSWNVDHSAENPDRAGALRAAIRSRFPELVS